MQGVRRRGTAAVAAIMLVAGMAVAVGGAGVVRGLTADSPAPKAAPDLGRLPLSFVENRGQLDGPARYYVAGHDTSVYFAPSAVTYALHDAHFNLRKEFVGARSVEPTAGEKAPGIVSYFKGQASEWKAGAATYSSVGYHDLWPGIDVVYSGTGSKLEYSFVVHPGADPSQIRLAYRGADNVSLNPQGQLVVKAGSGGFTDDAPHSFQDVDGRHVAVPSHWAPGSDGTYGLPVGPYDRTHDLVIDPVQFVYAGYLGGTAQDERGMGIAVDTAGNAYVTGATPSTEASFPVTVGPDVTENGGIDAYVAKIDPTGTRLIYAGYLGGSGPDLQGAFADLPPGNRIAVDSAGSAYLTGETGSADFPVAGSPAGLSSTYKVHGDAYVTKINPAGTGLVYSGFLGGSGEDLGFGLAVDGAANVYVAGSTSSSDFPVSVGPNLVWSSMGEQGFITKLDSTGAMVYSGYVGTGARAFSIAVDAAGAAYVTGWARPWNSFGTAPLFNPFNGTDRTDAFVAKVDPSGAGLDYAGYVGGNNSACAPNCLQYEGFDTGQSIAVDPTGAAYITGFTGNPGGTFPTKVGPDLTYNGGPMDAFVAKVNAAGTGLDYAGFIGGGGVERGMGIAVDATGAAYITGWTGSLPSGFPISADAPISKAAGALQGFVVKVAPGGTGVVWGTFLGGGSGHNAQTFAEGIAIDGQGGVYVNGYTSSGNLAPRGTPGLPYRFPGKGKTAANSYDTFVAKLSQ